VDDGTDDASDTVSVTVNLNYLDAPVIDSIQESAGGVLITWSPIPNADGYQVYRSSEPDGIFVLIGTTANISFEDTLALERAFYKVVAFRTLPTK
jgi:hypothetical protein